MNRILAIAAVHEVLTERRDDDVELDEPCSTGYGAMLVQGLGRVQGGRSHLLEPVALALGNRATALALVFSELLVERVGAWG